MPETNVTAAAGGEQHAHYIAPGHSFATITDKISSIVLTQKVTAGWLAGLGVSATLDGLLFVSMGYLFVKGIGIWGNNVPVGWAFDITNFEWWIGIGHAGTLISAILLRCASSGGPPSTASPKR